MENILFDQSPISTLDVSLSRSGKSASSYSSFSSSSSSSSSSYSPYSSASSISHLLHNYYVPPAMQKVNTVPKLYPNPTMSFSPSLAQPNQTPLLPLPSYKHTSFPSPCNNKTISNPSTPRRKPRAPKREPKVQTNKKKPLEKTLSTATTAVTRLANSLNELEDEVLIVSHVKDKDRFDRYSLSPPPSSLPLPGLSLLRRKTKVIDCCNAEAIIYEEVRSNSCSVDNCATDDLRRILRL